MSSIDYINSIPYFGTQISDGLRIGPTREIGERAQAIMNLSGTGLPLAPLVNYNGRIASSVNFIRYQASDPIGANTIVPFKINNIAEGLNGNMSDNKEVFQMDYPRTVEIIAVTPSQSGVNTINSLAAGVVTIIGRDIYGEALSEEITLTAITGLTRAWAAGAPLDYPSGGCVNNAANVSLEAVTATNKTKIFTADGFCSSRKAFFTVESVSLKTTGNLATTTVIWVRSGNLLGLPYFVPDNQLLSVDSGNLNSFIYSIGVCAFAGSSEVSTSTTSDVRGLFGLISKNATDLILIGGFAPTYSNGAIALIGNIGGGASLAGANVITENYNNYTAYVRKAANIPFRADYICPGFDLFSATMNSQKKKYFLTKDPESKALTSTGIIGEPNAINKRTIDEFMFGYAQNLYGQ